MTMEILHSEMESVWIWERQIREQIKHYESLGWVVGAVLLPHAVRRIFEKTDRVEKGGTQVRIGLTQYPLGTLTHEARSWDLLIKSE